MNDLLLALKAKERRGSKPRCHLLTHGSPGDVAARLTALAGPFASVAGSDRWMPQGFTDLEEAQLHKAPRLLPLVISARLREWWVPNDRQLSLTPNFDIASTCTIDGAPGLLLVIPVVLVYLAFLNAKDMSKPGEAPFPDAGAWEALVRSHSAPLFPGKIWNGHWSVNGVPLIPLIRSLELPLEV